MSSHFLQWSVIHYYYLFSLVLNWPWLGPQKLTQAGFCSFWQFPFSGGALPCFLAQVLTPSSPSFGISLLPKTPGSFSWRMACRRFGCWECSELRNVWVCMWVCMCMCVYINTEHVHPNLFLDLSLYMSKTMHLASNSNFMVHSNFFPFHICHSLLQ